MYPMPNDKYLNLFQNKLFNSTWYSFVFMDYLYDVMVCGYYFYHMNSKY